MTLSERTLIQRFEPLTWCGDRLLLFVALGAGDGVHPASPSVQTCATPIGLRGMEAKSLKDAELDCTGFPPAVEASVRLSCQIRQYGDETGLADA